ncbi:MAG: hypothetical protein ABIP48_17600 [Planctomycetota bacterium]
MVEIRNLKFQPLALHLANSKRTVHLASRGKAEIDDRDVSAEIRNAAQNGCLTLREIKNVRQQKPSAPKPVAKDNSVKKEKKGGNAT